CIGVVYLILEWFIKMRHAGSGVSLIAALMLASTWLLDNSIQPLMPASSPDRINRAGVMVVYISITLFLMAKCWLSIPDNGTTLMWVLRRGLPLLIMHAAIVVTLLYADISILSMLKTRKKRAVALLFIVSILLTAAGVFMSKALPLPLRDVDGRSVIDLASCVKLLVLPFLLYLLSMAIILIFADFRQIDSAAGKKLGKASYLCATFGFPFLGMGIITGSVWASQAWGRYWGWDPKETSSLLAWCIYAIYLHMRLIAGSGRIALSWIVVLGFWVVLFTYFGVNYLSLLGVDSLHIYSQ
ncbi:MAG: cytochrome c biogenesis protein CcsA, partial [Planctomycetota bacterium]